jgi:hypothetical protein
MDQNLLKQKEEIEKQIHRIWKTIFIVVGLNLENAKLTTENCKCGDHT